jgi:hypothetical protein
MTSLTKIGGGLGVDPEAGDWRGSMDSLDERAEKRFWVVVGCSQWKSLGSLVSRMESSWSLCPLFVVTLDLRPGNASLGGRLIHCQIRWVVTGRCCG